MTCQSEQLKIRAEVTEEDFREWFEEIKNYLEKKI